MFSQVSVILFTGRGHVWQEGMHGRGHAWRVILIKLFLSLSLKTVFRQKPLPIAVSAVAVYVGHCLLPLWQWLWAL